MENAADAVSKLFGKSQSTDQAQDSTAAAANLSNDASKPNTTTDGKTDHGDTTVDSEVAPSVEHTHIKKTHEEREQTFVDKEKHQDHYHTTIQPLKDSEVLPEKHDSVQETKERNIDLDDGTAKAKAERDQAGFVRSEETEELESKTKEPTKESEHVHHHLHETVQPVIEKEVIDPSVTHKRVDVKEKIQEPAKHHGVTTNTAVSVDEFADKLNEEKK